MALCLVPEAFRAVSRSAISRAGVSSSAARGSAFACSAGADPSGWLGEGCGTPIQDAPIQIVAVGLRYIAEHFAEPGALGAMVPSLGIPEDCLDFSFELIRGMTPAEALFEHRLNRLFAALSAQPRQGLRSAIVACGLSASRNVVGRFEQVFGIEMSLFLLTCRRAAEDRQFRGRHSEQPALIQGS